MNEETIKSKLVYEGRILNLRVDTVSGPNGISEREIIDHAQAVTILPFEAPNTIYLIHQFRKPTEQILIESPAGCIEDSEDVESAALRELTEETGFIAKKMTKVGEMYMAPGFCNEYMHFFIAQGLTSGATNFDSDEYIELKKYSLIDVKQMIKDGKIIDAKTILGVYFIEEFIREGTHIL